MSELRWILLAAGLVLLVALYVWGVRSRERSATRGYEASRRVEPPMPPTHATAPEPVRREPRLTLDDAPEATAADEPVLGSPLVDEVPVRRSATAETHTPAPAPVAAAVRVERAEPTLSEQPPAATPRPSPEPVAPPPGPVAAGEPRPSPKRPQKIVAIRVTASASSRFEGANLRDVLHRHGLQHGRFDIFHRLARDGRPIISLASVLEPGTFDPAAMDQLSYPGVALFTVLPGPVPALDALEDLLVTSRSIATQLGGTLLDDRGAPLSLQRIATMRDEVLAFERSSPPAAIRTP